MYTSILPSKAIPVGAAKSKNEISCIPAELSKKMHFCRFLQKEMDSVKTEAEKEAVHTILIKTKIQIRSLEREWKQLQALEQQECLDSQKVVNLYPAQ